MRRLWILMVTFLAALLSSCAGSGENAMLNRIQFERGHGSQWGNQLYIEVCPEEIVMARYIPEGSAELQTLAHIPITQEDWDRIAAAVQELKPELKQEKNSFWEGIFGNRKLDGGEFRKLTLYWQTNEKNQAIQYKWPAGQKSQALETQLEELLAVALEG